MKEYKKDSLRVLAYEDRGKMGAAAAADIAAEIRRRLAEKPVIRMIFAAAPSQNEVLSTLAADSAVDFSRVVAFHMDDYIGLPADAPQGFGNFLRARLFERVPFRAAHYIDGLAADPQAECERYAALLDEAAIDIVCMGIGENAHIAFNDPGFADFNDPRLVKVVELDEVCRRQQVNDGCFESLDKVPKYAITLTVPALMRAEAVYCVVPAKTKMNAVYHSLSGGITDECPASVLRRKEGAVLYLDNDSAGRLAEVPGLAALS